LKLVTLEVALLFIFLLLLHQLLLFGLADLFGDDDRRGLLHLFLLHELLLLHFLFFGQLVERICLDEQIDLGPQLPLLGVEGGEVLEDLAAFVVGVHHVEDEQAVVEDQVGAVLEFGDWPVFPDEVTLRDRPGRRRRRRGRRST